MDEGGVGGSDGADDDHGGHDEDEGDYKDGDNLVRSVQVLLDTGSSGPTSPSISSAADAQMLNPSQGHSEKYPTFFTFISLPFTVRITLVIFGSLPILQ